MFKSVASLLWVLSVYVLTCAGPLPAQEKKPISLQLKISDQDSGLAVDAKKTVMSGANGFDALRDVVSVKYTTFSKLGPFVTGLCGVNAPTGKFWALYVDGKLSDVGIGGITLSKDTLIEWKMQSSDRK